MTQYAFGDTALARERLALVADTFALPTRALLDDLPAGPRRYILDLGCGPGHTTALLRDAYPHGFVTGLDASEAMVAEARNRVPQAWFALADVAAPIPLPAHLVYARLLLGHLPQPLDALGCWANALLPGGALVCEEPLRYRSDDDVFARYERTVTDVVARSGGVLWAAPLLDAEPDGCVRALDRVIEHPVPATRAAAMFRRNAVTWGGERALIDALRSIEVSERNDLVMWEIRQAVWVKTPA